jgi:hypothetical protein
VLSLAVAAVHDVLERASGAEVQVQVQVQVQVHPIALPLDLIDRALAVVLTTGLEGEQLSVPGSAWSAARSLYCYALGVAMTAHNVSPRGVSACLAIRCPVGCALIILMIIRTILLDPTGAVWTDDAGNVSRLDPSGADQSDAEHPSRNRKVVGSNPTSDST